MVAELIKKNSDRSRIRVQSTLELALTVRLRLGPWERSWSRNLAGDLSRSDESHEEIMASMDVGNINDTTFRL